jgi:hypothetical protein
MTSAGQELTEPGYAIGDVLVAAVGDGSFEVSRVSANGRDARIMSVQTSQASALRVAERATSGGQRVFLRSDLASAYRPVA